MKKKPHQGQSVIKKVFSDFRKRVHNYENGPNNMAYEVQKTKDGYTVVVHRERGKDETLHFEDKQAVAAFLKSTK